MRPTRRAKTFWQCTGALLVAGAFLWQQSVSTLFAQSPIPQALKVPRLDVIVLAGDGGVNIVKSKKGVMPVVEVRDQERHPVAGLSVTFAAPTSGPHVTFAQGSSTYSTVTDTNGRATVPTITPVGQGEFKINVSATFQGLTATAVISQTNYLTDAAAKTGAGVAGTAGATTTATATSASHGISKTLIIVIIAGVAAGAGAAAALGKGGGGSSTSTPPSSPTGTIGGTGSSTIGPPH
jgi:hypothetical protein